MGHEDVTLSLKYRPKNLNQFIGNKEVVNVVKGMVKSKNVPRAVMLTGPPGTGKTTLSRLLLRYFNCDAFSACGKCESCLSMRGDKHPDYTEVNGSESGGIDDMRALINAAKYRPKHKLRVICIDEVHRISNPAANAILKPLEEPPPATMWVLATTDPDRIPNHQAVMSRCLVLNLSSATRTDTAKLVLRVGRAEKFKWLTKNGALKIAEASMGHPRNALQLLESTARYVDATDGDLDKPIETIIGDMSLQLGEGDIDRYALMALLALYTGDLRGVMKVTLGMDKDKFIQLASRMTYANLFALTKFTIGGHKAVWKTRLHEGLVKGLEDKGVYTDEIGMYIHDMLTDLSAALKSSYATDAMTTTLKHFGRVIAQHQGGE